MKNLSVAVPALLFFLAMAGDLQAQNHIRKDWPFGFFFTVPIEFTVIDNGALNESLADAGLPKSKYPKLTPGFGLQLFINRTITSLSFNKFTKKDKKNTYTTEVAYSAVSCNVGYDVIRNYRFSLYPYAGLKICGLDYLYGEKMPDTPGFNSYLQTPLNYKEISNSRGHVDLGVGFSTQFDFYLLNFRAGYLLPVEKGRWTINDGKVSLGNSPAVDYRFYFTLTAGLGAMVGDRQQKRRRYTESNML